MGAPSARAWLWHHRRDALAVYGDAEDGFIVAPPQPTHAPDDRPPNVGRKGRWRRSTDVIGRPTGFAGDANEQAWKAAVRESFLQATCSASIQGYQADAERVDRIVQAIYEVVQRRRIAYSNAPASWGDRGQKVRTPTEVLDGGVGTCLDTVVVLAAALEQAGSGRCYGWSRGTPSWATGGSSARWTRSPKPTSATSST